MTAARLPRSARRLLFAALVLAAIDPLIPGLLHRLEAARYESGHVFRFENSDLFSLGPVVQYLRQHPQGRRPRVVFFGNSVVWGYFLEPEQSLPAEFQRLTPTVHVFNMAVNGFESGSAYLISKNIVDAVDTIYLVLEPSGRWDGVSSLGRTAHPMLPQLVRVEKEDLERFALTPPDRVEARLADLLGVWSLYRDAYRLQAALFGTSTRVYVYQHKMSIPTTIWRTFRGRPANDDAERASPPAPGVDVNVEMASAPLPAARRRELAAAYPFLWEYAELVRTHQKHAVIVQIHGYSAAIRAVDRADLNLIFRPHVSFVEVSIPRTLRMADGLHLSAEGARAVAQALRRHVPPVAR
jgi:hypothetical protein